MLKNKTVAFLGAGSMAESMISGVLKAGKMTADQIFVTNKYNEGRLKNLKDKYGVNVMSKEQLPYEKIDFIILAMKPNGVAEVLSEIKDKLYPSQVIISVLAGITTEFIEEFLKDGQQVVRVMPNTSSMIQESATALVPGVNVNSENVLIIQELFECMGEVFLIEEEHMDVFTGIAGSGPAYFYFLMEQIESVGKEKGLDEETVRKIVAQTVYGAAKMVIEKEEDPAVLRKNVTSPNGTTEAGLKALERFGGATAISQAVYHAAERSNEICKSLENLKQTT